LRTRLKLLYGGDFELRLETTESPAFKSPWHCHTARCEPLPPQKIRALVVDDEPLARSNLKVLLQRDKDIESIQECGSGAKPWRRFEQLGRTWFFSMSRCRSAVDLTSSRSSRAMARCRYRVRDRL